MLLRVAKSGSDGNSFALETDKEILLIEAGVDIRTIKKMVDYRIEKVSGLIVSYVDDALTVSGEGVENLKLVVINGLNYKPVLVGGVVTINYAV